MMQPPPSPSSLFSPHTTPCLSPFLLAIQYWMGGGYELSNPKGNVPCRQLPGEKWPHLGRKCVCLHADVWVWGGWSVWHGAAGVTQLWTAIPPLSASVLCELTCCIYIHKHIHNCTLWLMIAIFLFFPFIFLEAMFVQQMICQFQRTTAFFSVIRAKEKLFSLLVMSFALHHINRQNTSNWNTSSYFPQQIISNCCF